MNKNKVVEMWAIFDHPNEHPENFVAKRFLNSVPTNDFIISVALEKVKQALADKGLVQVQFKNENPKIIQIWMRGGGLN